MDSKSLVQAFNQYVLNEALEEARSNLHIQIDIFTGQLENNLSELLIYEQSFNESIVCLTTLLNEKKLDSTNLPYKILNILFKIVSDKGICKSLWDPSLIPISILSHLNSNYYDTNEHIYIQCLKILEITLEYVIVGSYIYYLLSETIKTCVDLIFNEQEGISSIALGLIANLSRRDNSGFFNYFVSSWSLTRVKTFCRTLLKYFDCSNKVVMLNSLMLYLNIACRSSPEINKAFLTSANISQAMQIIFASIATQKDPEISVIALKLMTDIIYIPAIYHFLETYDHLEHCLNQTFKVFSSNDPSTLYQVSYLWNLLIYPPASQSSIADSSLNNRTYHNVIPAKNERLARRCRKIFFNALFPPKVQQTESISCDLSSFGPNLRGCIKADDMDVSFGDSQSGTEIIAPPPSKGFLMTYLVSSFKKMLIPQTVPPIPSFSPHHDANESTFHKSRLYGDLRSENRTLLSTGGLLELVANIVRTLGASGEMCQSPKVSDSAILNLLERLWLTFGEFLEVITLLIAPATTKKKRSGSSPFDHVCDNERYLLSLLYRLSRTCPLMITIYTSIHAMRRKLGDASSLPVLHNHRSGTKSLWTLCDVLLGYGLSNFDPELSTLDATTKSTTQQCPDDPTTSRVEQVWTECCLWCCYLAVTTSTECPKLSQNVGGDFGGGRTSLVSSLFGIIPPFPEPATDSVAKAQQAHDHCNSSIIPWLAANLAKWIPDLKGSNRKVGINPLEDRHVGTNNRRALVRICIELAIRALNKSTYGGEHTGIDIGRTSRQILNMTGLETFATTNGHVTDPCSTASGTILPDPFFWTFDQNNGAEDGPKVSALSAYEPDVTGRPPNRRLFDSMADGLTSNYEMNRDSSVSDLMEMCDSRRADTKLRERGQRELISAHNSLINQLQAQLNLHQGTAIKHEAQCTRFRHIISALEDQKTVLGEEIKEWERGLQKYKEALKYKEVEIKSMTRALDDGKANLATETSRREGVQKNLEAVKMECNSLREMHQVLQKHHEQSKMQQETLNQQISLVENENSRLNTELKDRESKVQELSQHSENVSDLLDKSEKENEKLHITLEQMRRDVSKIDEARKKLCIEKASLESLCRQQESTLVEKDDQIKKLRNDLMFFTEITSKINHLTMDIKPRH